MVGADNMAHADVPGNPATQSLKIDLSTEVRKSAPLMIRSGGRILSLRARQPTMSPEHKVGVGGKPHWQASISCTGSDSCARGLIRHRHTPMNGWVPAFALVGLFGFFHCKIESQVLGIGLIE